MATKKNTVLTIDLSKENQVYSAKGKSKLLITGINQNDLEFIDITSDGKNIYFTTKPFDEDPAVVLAKITNANGIKYSNAIKEYGKQYYTVPPIEQGINYSSALIDGGITYNGAAFKIKKNKVTGSKYNDKLDFSSPQYIKGLTINGGNGADTLTGTSYNDTINGGSGDDLLCGSPSADKLSGGKGLNEILYDSLDDLDGDKIYPSKGEKLAILVNINKATAEYRVSGKNLIVYITNPMTNEIRSFTIMNFGTKDSFSNAKKNTPDSSMAVLLLKDNDIEGGFKFNEIDLKSLDVVVESNVGTWRSDRIDRRTYTNKKKKGLTINGKTGDDEIIATRYSDTIKAGGGLNNKISGLGGNDKLYAGTSLGSKTSFYFATGDGKDTVYSGNGEDTLCFCNAQGIYENDLMSGKNFTFTRGTKKSNKNDLIIKYSDKDTVTVKNYFTGKNTIKHIEVAEGVLNLADLVQNGMPQINVIVSSDNPLNGTTEADLITSTYVPVGDERATVNALAGDDIINISNVSHAPKVYVGAGNDRVLLEASKPDVDIYFGNGDGDNTLEGLNSDINEETKIRIFGENMGNVYELGENIGEFTYVTGEEANNGNDLKLASGNSTLTINNYYTVLQPARDTIKFNNQPIGDLLYLAEDVITVQNSSYTNNEDEKLIIAPDTNTAREITVQGDYNSVVAIGSNTQAINVEGNANLVKIYNNGSSDNFVNRNSIAISGDNNIIYTDGGHHSSVTFDDNLTNEITLYGPSGSTIATSGGTNGSTNVVIDLANNAYEATVTSQGDDDITVNKGVGLINITGEDNDIAITAEENATVIIAGAQNTSSVDITRKFGYDAQNIMFSYYSSKRIADNNFLEFYCDTQNDGIKQINGTSLFGSWIKEDNVDVSFGLDDAELGANISLTVKKDNESLKRSLTQMTQYVDMADESIETAYGYKLFSADDEILKNIAKDVYILGTETKDDYRFESIDKKYTINDLAGEDTMTINQDASEDSNTFRLFFDIDKSGNLGSDLYIMSIYDTNDNMLKFINNQDADYICIKDFFGNSNGIFGAGCIDTIEGAGGDVDFEAYIGNVKSQMQGWLTNNSQYDTMLEAIQHGEGDNALYELYAAMGEVADSTGEIWKGVV